MRVSQSGDVAAQACGTRGTVAVGRASRHDARSMCGASMSGFVAAGAAIIVCAALAGCAPSASSPVIETLDGGTGTTIVRLEAPIELIAAEPAARGAEPFAWLGPFETNRMGARSLYLWIATPPPASPAGPRVRCGELELDGADTRLTPEGLGLSKMPYRNPAPWNDVTLLPLPAAWVDCLAGAAPLAIDVDATPPARYVDDGHRRSDLVQFRVRVTQ